MAFDLDDEENKATRKMNGADKSEDIKILEMLIKVLRNSPKVEEPDSWETAQAIENILARNKELEEMLQHRIKYTNELEKDLFENASNYVVPKSVIKEKIEEYKHQYETKFQRIDILQNIIGMSIEELEELRKLQEEVFEIQDKIEVLQELLEKEK